MSIVNEDGTPLDRRRLTVKRPRGLTLTEPEIREWGDLLYGLLFEVGGMSVPDAMAVMQRQLCERQVRNRRRKVADRIRRFGMVKLLEHAGRKRVVQRAG